MAKMLNLDEVGVEEVKTVVVGGHEYTVKPLSVADFIALAKEEIDAPKDMEMDVIGQTESMIRMIGHVIPDMPKDVVNSLTTEKLVMLINFVQSVAEEGSESVEEGK